MRLIPVFVLPLVVALAIAREKAPHTSHAASSAVAPGGSGPQRPTAANPPEPGACTYSQPGVKVCSALFDGQGAFDVLTFTPAFLYVRTEEPIVNVIPPDPHFFQTDRRENTVVIVPTRDKLPERTPAVITTKSLVITLNVRPGSREKVDTQLTVLDPMRNRRNAQVAEAVAALEPKLLEKKHAAELEDLARAGAELKPVRGETVGRNAELIVLRAIDVLRAGSHRFLFFSLQNRSADPFQLRAVRVGTGPRDAQATWRIAAPIVAPGEESRGVVELSAAVGRGAHLKLSIEEVDPRRNVELPELEIP